MEHRAEWMQGWVLWIRAQDGLGTCCQESQADGVPCADPGVECGDCAVSRELALRYATEYGEAPPPGVPIH